ncbi:MAG: signal peptide peptidase SppA, partial [Bacteroidales bacterium]|nr:signal peptide peptidase SppA [Bacteroidales bacterium]
MKNGFWKMTLASGLGFILASVVFSILSGIMMFLFVISLGTSQQKTIKKHSVLTIDLSQPINEREATTIQSLMFNEKTVGLNTVLAAIESAATDKKIEGIFLKPGITYTGGWSTTQEIRAALEKFKESGKFVYAYADYYTQKTYYLATVADKIYLNPAGMVEFAGISAEAMFVKDLLDKLDINVELIRPNSNAYKSAGEMYTMNKMSEANREQIRTYIKSIWDEVLPQMSEARGISVDSLNMIADNLSAFLAEDAFEAGLVDVLGFENDVKEQMFDNIEGVKLFSNLHLVKVSDYPIKNKKKSSDKIAVIYAEGEVQMGKGYDVGVYQYNITKALDDAADDDDVKAIVLRVNSPGGVATASEVITDAVIRAKEQKPVIVSMGDLAALAGYEISCHATKIVTMPTTITGSIGVFGMLPEVGSMLKNKLGITFDTVNTNRNSSALSMTRPLSPEARALMQKNVEEFYKGFVA